MALAAATSSNIANIANTENLDTSLNVKRLSPVLGAEVTSFDVAGCTDAQFEQLLTAWDRAHGLLVLRDVHISPAEHIAFARRFGEPAMGTAGPHSILGHYWHPEFPAIYRVSNKVINGVPQGREDAGTYWHTDGTHGNTPSRCSLLYGLELPPCGGDTIFASLSTSYEALSDTMKRLLQGLTAVHTLAKTLADGSQNSYAKELIGKADLAAAKTATHPVVRYHARTGHRSLFVNPGFTSHIVGMHSAESKALLEFLFAHTTQQEFLYRHQWRRNDLVIWDNTCTMHYAVSDYKAYGVRYMHRVSVKGETPVAA